MKTEEIDGPIRPWGHYEILLDESYCKVKRIVVKPECRLSYQYHYKRKEAWTVVQGVATVTVNGVMKDYFPGETVLIGFQDKHRMANNSKLENMILIEVQTGSYFGEDDIVRIEDDFNRE
jgi:mannose-6-phosphate isomerase